MSTRWKIISLISITALAVAVYLWIYYLPKYDLKLTVIGFQGDISVNGKPLSKNTQQFNANKAVIEVSEGGIFNAQLEDGSYIQLTENSKLIINEAKRNHDGYRVRTKFTLDTGEIIRDIPKIENISDYSSSLITNSVDIGVRGTKFITIAEDKNTRTMLHRGAVTLDSKGQGLLDLLENFGTITEKGKASQPPVELLPPPFNLSSVSGKRVTTQQWKIRWQAVSNAKAYLVEVAVDDNFRNLVFRKQTSTNNLTIENLPYDTNFRWRVASIDDKGLRGLESQFGNIDYRHHNEKLLTFNGSAAEAESLIEKALHGYPNDVALLKVIGDYYYRTKQFQKAVTFYSRAIELGADNQEIYLARGRAYQAIGKSADAQQDFNKILTAETNSAEAFWSLGNVEADKKLTENSIEYYYRAIAVQPNHTRAHLSAAREWIKLGRRDKAYRHLQLHAENYPNDKAARRTLEELALIIDKESQGKTSK